MADDRTKIDVNQEHTIAGVTYDANQDIMNLTLNPVDKRLRVDSDITDVGDGATSAKQDTQQATLDALLSGTVTHTYVNTAVTLSTNGTAYKLPASEQTDRKYLVVSNISNYDVYIGGSSVTTSNGILMIPGSTIGIASESGIYAVSGTDSVVINIMELK